MKSNKARSLSEAYKDPRTHLEIINHIKKLAKLGFTNTVIMGKRSIRTRVDDLRALGYTVHDDTPCMLEIYW